MTVCTAVFSSSAFLVYMTSRQSSKYSFLDNKLSEGPSPRGFRENSYVCFHYIIFASNFFLPFYFLSFTCFKNMFSLANLLCDFSTTNQMWPRKAKERFRSTALFLRLSVLAE